MPPMLAAVMEGTDDLRPREVPTPTPGPGDVLVKVGANTICGTDGRILRAEKTAGVELPVVLGHEIAGTVEASGAGAERFEPGMPVALQPNVPCLRCRQCRSDREHLCESLRIFGYAIDGGMAEYVLVPAAVVAAGCLFEVHAQLPFEQLALAEPLGCVVLGQRWSPVHPDDVVLVLGAGPIGLLHLQLALVSGARAVIVSQRSAGRRELAAKLGAVAVDPASEDLADVVEEVSGGAGVDASFVCAGVPALVDEAVRLSAPAGRVSVFAGLPKPGLAEVDVNLLHYKQILLSGTSGVRRSDFEVALHLIESGRIDSASMITHRFGIADVEAAFAAAQGREAIKVALVPGHAR